MCPKVRNVNTLAAGYTPSSMQDVGSFMQFLQAIYVNFCIAFIYSHCVVQYFFFFLPRFSEHDITLCTVSD